MKFEIINGDAVSVMPSLPKDAFIMSDPPYNQGYHYATYKDRLKAGEYLELLSKTLFDNEQRKSVVIHYPEETINLMGGGNFGSVDQVVSWVYNSNTAKQHRLITWWNCKPDFRKIPQPYKNPTDKRIAKRIAEGKSARSYDWWEINQVKNVSKSKNPHPCPVPLELMRRIIVSTTKEGDTIIDPFMGSGTTGIAALQCGRNFIGIEMDKDYCEIAEVFLTAEANK